MAVEKRRGPDLSTSDLWAGDDDYWRCLVPGADVRVVTSGGTAIEAHSSVLAAASPVLEARIFRRSPRRHHSGLAILPIRGVPCDAVLGFLRCLYRGEMMVTTTTDTDATTTNGNHTFVHLLVLSHAMRVPWLKLAAESSLAASLRAEDIADLLQLSRLCDAPRLRVRCLNYIRRDRASVEATEGWRFLKLCDPRTEADVMRFVKEADRRDERRRRRREENTAYAELGDAVECLHHILRDGCGGVGPKNDAKLQQQPTGILMLGPLKGSDDASCCRWGQTCQGLRVLIRHFATCQLRRSSCAAGTGCARCGRMVQLLRLHAAISYELHPMSPPPLASVSAPKTREDDNNDKWRLLARKVVSAKLMSTLTLSKRKREPADVGRSRESIKPWKKNHGLAP